MGRPAAYVLAAFLCAIGVAAPRPAGAQTDAGPPATDSGPPRVEPKKPPDVAELRRRATGLEAYAKGTLEPAIDPQTLFDVPLGDERAIAVEVARLQAIVARADAGAGAATRADAGPSADAGTRSEAGATDAAVPPAPPDPDLWEARLAVDRATLAILRLPAERRKELARTHAEAVANAPQDVERAIDDATRKAKAAEEAQAKALMAAREAASEARKLVSEEIARLHGVKADQANYEATLARVARDLEETGELGLQWRRKVSELVEQRREGKAQADDADRIYGQLVTVLRASRDELWNALDDVDADTRVPAASTDRLDDVGVEVDRADVDALRAEIGQAEQRLAQRESKLRRDRANVLMARIETLNRSRLSLYPHLTASRRDQLTGFSPEGLTQGRAELKQVTLVARYRKRTVIDWILGDESAAQKDRTFQVVATVNLIKVLALLVAWSWWRRRAPELLERLRERVAQAAAKRPHQSPWAVHGISVLERIRGAAEVLLVAWVALWALGPAMSSTLEVRLAWLVLAWIVGGIVAVNLLDAIAAQREDLVAGSGALRLRTLRLIGRVIVVVGLTLAVTSELVGQGTIYDWVLGTCWFAAIPVAAVVVGWWRPVVFARLEPRALRSGFARWVGSNSAGPLSFVAAAAGGSFLLGLWVLRFGRTYIGGFNLTRRVLAYLFRRQMSKREELANPLALAPLAPSAVAALDPERHTEDLVASQSDADAERVAECIERVGGGVFAVVGERGSGKSTLLRRLARERDDTTFVACPPSGAAELQVRLAEALKLPATAGLPEIAAHLEGLADGAAVLVDDLHLVVRPTIGGLADFDRVVAMARHASTTCTWVFCLDAALWRFVERARGAQPLFDAVVRMAPWSEESIGELLVARSREASIEPSFERLLTEQIDDDIEREERLLRIRAGYHRLVWDYAAGNPAAALHLWQRCLGVDAEGTVHARVFAAPETSALESLPDSAVFTLRAVIQLEPATAEDVIEATQLPAARVQDALRHAVFKGYINETDGRLRVTWEWYRAVTRFLQRRHLLSMGS